MRGENLLTGADVPSDIGVGEGAIGERADQQGPEGDHEDEIANRGQKKARAAEGAAAGRNPILAPLSYEMHAVCRRLRRSLRRRRLGHREAQGYWKRGRGRKAARRIQSTIFAALQLAAFPYFIPIAGRNIHPHTFFESLGYAAAFVIFLLLRGSRGDSLPYPLRWATLATAFAGGTLGSKLLYWLEDPQLTMQHLHDPTYLVGGKTIVGALLGGLFAVEAFKRYMGLRQSTGDRLAIPVAAGIAPHESMRQVDALI